MASDLSRPFFATRDDVVELARRRYFEDGVPPSGIVSEAVFQSWTRCQRLHDSPSGDVVFQPVTPSRTHHALQKNRVLHEAWQAELPQLQMLLGTTTCAAMLTDASGVLIGATCAGRSHERLMPVATRLGVDLSEEAVGTTAPGVVTRTGQPVCVLGAEHFFDSVQQMHCAAAPIRDIHGRLAGVLDISSEAIPFRFDASTVVGHFACAMENRVLLAQAEEHLVVRLQIDASLLDSPLVGLVGIDATGSIAWVNSIAARLIDVPAMDRPNERLCAETRLGTGVARLAALPRTGAAALSLPSGLTVWVRSEMRAHDGLHHVFPVAAEVRHAEPAGEASSNVALSQAREEHTRAIATSAPRERLDADGCPPKTGPSHATAEALVNASATLLDANRHLIELTLRDCGGNLSDAARRLGVSRGWIYRRLSGDRATRAKRCTSRQGHASAPARQAHRPTSR